MPTFNREISLTLGGEAGQGIQTIEYLLVNLFKAAGYQVYATKEYMSRVRGGSNSTTLRVGEKTLAAPCDRIDLLIPLDKDSLSHLKNRISPQTLIIGDKTLLGEDYPVIDVPWGKLASQAGAGILANTVATAFICGMMELNEDLLNKFLAAYFDRKTPEIVEQNLNAAKIGLEWGHKIASEREIKIVIQPQPQVKGQILLNGAEAIALGAVAGGCNFVSAYPMTPSTGIFTTLAQNAEKLGLAVEQAEDEISAVNMALGAWYAGARALVPTSGGGFALMVEGISLSGMLETPLVISLGQRPGPATGLPTRTEQADLEFALYAGHGEFPRIILAPGTLQEAFTLSAKAFNLADKCQSPVIILSDQYFVDAYYNIEKPDLAQLKPEYHLIKTASDYRRYALTEDGLSPRGIPGYGEGLVCVDSDEHDETGHITEDMEVRSRMVEKRLKKLEAMKDEAISPTLLGGDDYRNLVIAWGSNYQVVKEALEGLNLKDTAFLHFSQLHPLHRETAKFLSKAKKLILLENNATGQFGKLLQLETGIKIENRILKYNGLPFTVEEVTESLKSLLEGGLE